MLLKFMIMKVKTIIPGLYLILKVINANIKRLIKKNKN